MMMGLLLFIFIITLFADTQSIVTIKKVSVQEGVSIIIPCSYNSTFTDHVKYLCSGYVRLFCENVAYSNQNDHSRWSISDDQKKQTFTVTMKNILMSDAGYYWCSIDINGHLDKQKRFLLEVTKASVPRELYVDNQTVTGCEGKSVTVSCYHHSRAPKQWCKLGGVCVKASGSIDGATVQLRSSAHVLTVTMSRLTLKNAGWYWCSVGDLQIPVHITVQTNLSCQTGPGKLESRKFFAWLVFLGFLIVLTSLAVILLKSYTQKCKVVSGQNRSENDYVSMNKSQPTTMQCGEHEPDTQDYEVMSRIDQALEGQMKRARSSDTPNIGSVMTVNLLQELVTTQQYLGSSKRQV